jgi:hypothetical protein
MLHPRFFCCHHAVKESLTFIFLAKKFAGKCQIFELSPLPWECEEPICTNLRVFKNISKVTHTFLSNANFVSKIWAIGWFSLISSSVRPLWNSSVACYRSSNSLFITLIRFCSFTVSHLFAQRRTVLSQFTNHHNEQLAYVGEFQLEQGFLQSKTQSGHVA